VFASRMYDICVDRTNGNVIEALKASEREFVGDAYVLAPDGLGLKSLGCLAPRVNLFA
jgi:hypothetical protein